MRVVGFGEKGKLLLSSPHINVTYHYDTKHSPLDKIGFIRFLAVKIPSAFPYCVLQQQIIKCTSPP